MTINLRQAVSGDRKSRSLIYSILLGLFLLSFGLTSQISAQNTLNNVGLTSATPASAAFSLRLLSSSFTGPLARITIGSNYYDVYPDASTNKTFSTSSPISAAYTTYNAAAMGELVENVLLVDASG